MKILGLVLLMFAFSPKSFAADLTSVFKSVYALQASTLTAKERQLIKSFDIYLLPGLMSETFLKNDHRSQVNFSKITGEYLGESKKVLQQYGFVVRLLKGSSRSVEEIKSNIHYALEQARFAKRKVLFMAHSMGGLALLEELVTHPEEQKFVGGIIFLQSPFYGTSIADFYFEESFQLNELLNPFLPFLNMSPETLHYLGTKSREEFMADNKDAVAGLIAKVPLFTVSGALLDEPTALAPAVNLMSYGCLSVASGKCLTESLMAAPYEVGDGLVPLKSSILPKADYIVLEGVDHAETVVNLPFTDYEQGAMTETLFRILAAKINTVK